MEKTVHRFCEFVCPYCRWQKAYSEIPSGKSFVKCDSCNKTFVAVAPDYPPTSYGTGYKIENFKEEEE